MQIPKLKAGPFMWSKVSEQDRDTNSRAVEGLSYSVTQIPNLNNENLLSLEVIIDVIENHILGIWETFYYYLMFWTFRNSDFRSREQFYFYFVTFECTSSKMSILEDEI